MFVLGHIGLTIGLILILFIIFKKPELAYEIDLRIIAILSILPDIIDKILGHLILHDLLNNGRLFSHTLVFLIFFSIVFISFVRKYWWVYAFPIFTHQIFDQLWSSPKTWLWPAYGWGFERLDIDVWVHWLTALSKNPYNLSTEIFGFIVIICLVIVFKLYTRKNFNKVMKTGRLNKPYLHD